MDNQLNIYDGVIARLKFFKYEVNENEKSIIDYSIITAISSVNNYTNQCYTQNNIPYGLYSVIVDKVVGDFLMFKKNIGELPESIDLSPLEKEIKMGDTTTSYQFDSNASPEKLFNLMLDYLRFGRDYELKRYRRLTW